MQNTMSWLIGDVVILNTKLLSRMTELLGKTHHYLFCCFCPHSKFRLEKSWQTNIFATVNVWTSTHISMTTNQRKKKWWNMCSHWSFNVEVGNNQHHHSQHSLQYLIRSCETRSLHKGKHHTDQLCPLDSRCSPSGKKCQHSRVKSWLNMMKMHIYCIKYIIPLERYDDIWWTLVTMIHLTIFE